MLELSKNEKETIFVLPEGSVFATISTYDDALKEILANLSRMHPCQCEQLYHTAEGRDTFSVYAGCVAMMFAPVSGM